MGQYEQEVEELVSSSVPKSRETLFQGHTIVPGNPIYTHISAVVDNRIDVDQFNHSIFFEVDAELSRFHEALRHSLEALELLSLKFQSTHNRIEADIVASQIALISDPIFRSAIEEGIKQRGQRVEQAVAHAMFHLRHAFSCMPGSQFSERYDDVEDVCYRILSSLNRKKRRKESELLRKLVKEVRRPGLLGAVVSYSLAPSIASELTANRVLAVITCQGGAMSHTAVVCRAKGIPYISGVPEDILTKVKTSDAILIQPELGIVTIHPTLQRLNACLAQKKSSLRRSERPQGKRAPLTEIPKKVLSCHLNAETHSDEKDLNIEVCSTVDGPDEISQSIEYNIQKVGLYRTEYLVFQRRLIPSFEDQVEEYKKCIQPLNGQPIAFRTFDFSSDKSEGQLDSRIPALKDEQRGVSLISAYPNIVKKQLLAIFSAAHQCRGCDVRILFPMVSSKEILQKYLAIFSSAWELYSKQHIEEQLIAKPKVGIMIELPLAALQISQFKEDIDFISIGTNDLLQFTLAIDRVSNTPLDGDQHPFSGHVGFLHIIKHIVNQAKKEEIPLCLCGELASDPLFIPIFLGFGITSFSVPPRRAREVSEVIQLSQGQKVDQLASQVLLSASSSEVLQKARAYASSLQR